MKNNRILSLVLVAFAVVASGCTSVTGPNPDVISTESEQGLIGSLTGDTTITATIVNQGSAGEIEIIAEFVDDEGSTVGTTRETLAIGEGERREVEIDASVPDGASSYSVEANTQ